MLTIQASSSLRVRPNVIKAKRRVRSSAAKAETSAAEVKAMLLEAAFLLHANRVVGNKRRRPSVS